MTYTDIKSDGGMDPRNEGLPEPTGVVIGEERGYCDWGHVVDWGCYGHLPKGTKFYTADQLLAYGAAKDAEIERLTQEAEAGLFVHHREMDALRSEIERLRAVLDHTSKTLHRQLDLIADRAKGEYLDKRPVVQSLTSHALRIDAALKESKNG